LRPNSYFPAEVKYLGALQKYSRRHYGILINPDHSSFKAITNIQHIFMASTRVNAAIGMAL